MATLAKSEKELARLLINSFNPRPPTKIIPSTLHEADTFIIQYQRHHNQFLEYCKHINVKQRTSSS